MIIIMKQGTTHEHVEELSQHIEIGFSATSSGGNFIIAGVCVRFQSAGHSLKAALGTITFLCHRFV